MSKEIFDDLRKSGYRITSQRETILDIFRNLPEGDHLSVEELYNLLQAKDIKISLATLYRTLKLLASKGLLRELDFAEVHKHYELVSENRNHHHLICNKCGLTIEFDDDEVAEHAQKVALSQKDFKVMDYQFKIFGLCKNCL